MILNGTFNSGWRHGIAEPTTDNGWIPYRHPAEDDPPGDQGIKLPNNWRALIAGPMVTNPYYDGNPVNRFGKPELDLKLWSSIPEHERELLFLEPPAIFKPFSSNTAMMFELLQDQDLQAGWRLFSARVYPDPVAGVVDGEKRYATDRAAFIQFVTNDKRHGWIDVTPKTDRETMWHSYSVLFYADGPTTYGLGFMSPWGLHHGNNWFCDSWSLETVDLPVWSPPRTEYRKRYHLIDRDVTWEEARKTFKVIFNQKGTGGFGADDAGIGPEEREIIGWGFDEQGKEDHTVFFDTEYPGALLKWVDSDEPEIPMSTSTSASPSASPSPGPGPVFG